MKESKMMRTWNLVYPVGIYFVVTVVTLFILDFVLPDTINNSLLRQLITSVAVLPFLYSFYRQDRFSRGDAGSTKQDFMLTKTECKIMILLFLGSCCFAVAWNNVLGFVRIADYSESYRQVRETFYRGKILLEFLAVCMAAPLAEELLYRGIVYGRARRWLGKNKAVVISAFIFGIIHMNLVQFVYAFVFGLLLACFVEETGMLHSAFLAHAGANLTSLLRAETGVFSFMDKSPGIGIVLTLLLFLAAVGLIYPAVEMCKKQKSDVPDGNREL